MPKPSIESRPELNAASRTLASLALDRLRQEGGLAVRQREQLRRALATAGEALEWGVFDGERADGAAAAKKDLAALAELGANSLEQDLARQLEEKRAEIDALEDVTRSLRALAADAETVYPAEVAYTHTARDSQRQLVTKIATLVLVDADGAATAASSLEKKLDGFTKLRDEMIDDLRQSRRRIGEMRKELGGFIQASNGLVLEVLATLT